MPERNISADVSRDRKAAFLTGWSRKASAWAVCHQGRQHVGLLMCTMSSSNGEAAANEWNAVLCSAVVGEVDEEMDSSIDFATIRSQPLGVISH